MAVLSDDMGGITAYAAAVNRGYTGTKEEFEQLMYSYTEVAERAEAAAGNAHESEEGSIEAKDIAVNAKNEAVSARDAAQSARDASISAKNDSESARDVAINAKNDTLAAKDAVMSAKSSVDETSANFSDEVTAAISDVNAAGRNQKELAKTHAVDSEAWAVGQREGADVGVSDTTYHNNSKYYAEQSALAKDASVSAKNAAESAKADAIAAKNEAETAKGEAQEIVDGIQEQSDQIQINKEDISDLKSDFTALESDGVVPSADQILTDKGITDSVPYHYRKTVGDGADRLYDQIVGGTVCWNQLIHISQSSASKTENGITFIDNRDGSYTFSTVESGATQNTFLIIDQTLNAIKEDHVFVILGLNASSSFSRWYVGDFYNLILQPELGKANSIVKSTGNGRLDVRIKVSANAVITTPITINPQYIDLTAMFGSTVADYIYQLEQTTAGAGVAFFKALFPNDYYPYNAGELLSVSGLSEHKMVGFNQWDEEWEVGDYKYGDGEPYASSNFIRSKTNNYIPVVPGASYYFNTSGAIMDVFYYDYNKAYTNTHVSRNNQTLTIPNGVYFIRFSVSATTYNHNICINLSDPAKNGTYEPYKAHSYPLDSTLTLRGITKLVDGKVCFDGDTYDADGTVTRRYGVVDLGDQSWIYTQPTSDFQYGYFTAAISGKAAGRQNIICGKYPTSYASSLEGVDKECLGSAATTNFFVVDSAYSDAASFKTAMSGVYIVYELAIPTTEEADPYQHLQQCDPNGTEEYVSTGIVPVGHNSFYPENLRAKVEQLPWNFASLIAPTEATFTATRNYTTGSLFIVDNVLYKATANIANGGTITPNTNCTATTLAEIISALA